MISTSISQWDGDQFAQIAEYFFIWTSYLSFQDNRGLSVDMSRIVEILVKNCVDLWYPQFWPERVNDWSFSVTILTTLGTFFFLVRRSRAELEGNAQTPPVRCWLMSYECSILSFARMCALFVRTSVQVSSKRVADQLLCFGDNNFEWRRHYNKPSR